MHVCEFQVLETSATKRDEIAEMNASGHESDEIFMEKPNLEHPRKKNRTDQVWGQSSNHLLIIEVSGIIQDDIQDSTLSLKGN